MANKRLHRTNFTVTFLFQKSRHQNLLGKPVVMCSRRTNE